MLIRTFTQYLESHKRLVIPQLGTFIVKEPGQSIVFSELLKRDDGVLRALLAAEGMSELEAAGEIDRFVFEVRHAAEHGQEYPLEGFGVMKPGPNGTIAFVYEPQARLAGKDAAEPAQRAADTPQEAVTEPAPKVSPSVKMQPEPYVKGLRYGKPRKTTDAYRYVDRPPRRGADRFVWVAVIAALIAVAAIAFGYFREKDEPVEQLQHVEQPAPATAADDAPTE